jgi:hypothetical protein
MLVHAAVQIWQGLPKCPDLPSILSQPVVLGPHEVNISQPTRLTGQPRAEKGGHRLYGHRSVTIVCEADPRPEDATSLERAVDDVCFEPRARVLEVDPQFAPQIVDALFVSYITEPTADD